MQHSIALSNQHVASTRNQNEFQLFSQINHQRHKETSPKSSLDEIRKWKQRLKGKNDCAENGKGCRRADGKICALARRDVKFSALFALVEWKIVKCTLVSSFLVSTVFIYQKKEDIWEDIQIKIRGSFELYVSGWLFSVQLRTQRCRRHSQFISHPRLRNAIPT